MFLDVAPLIRVLVGQQYTLESSRTRPRKAEAPRCHDQEHRQHDGKRRKLRLLAPHESSCSSPLKGPAAAPSSSSGGRVAVPLGGARTQYLAPPNCCTRVAQSVASNQIGGRNGGKQRKPNGRPEHRL